MAMLKVIIRLLPGVLGNSETILEESYAVGTEFFTKYTTQHKEIIILANAKLIISKCLSII